MKIYRIDNSGSITLPVKRKNSGVWVDNRSVALSEVCDVSIGEDCVRKWQLMSEDSITLKFNLAEAIVFKIGDFLWFEGERYALCEPYIPSDDANTGGYSYDMTFKAYYMLANNRTLKLTEQGLELSWVSYGLATTFMGLVADNIRNNNISHWLLKDGVVYESDYHFSVQNYQPEQETGAINTTYKTIEFNSVKLIDAITTIAQEWHAEWYISEYSDEGNNLFVVGHCEVGDAIALHRDTLNGEEGNIVSIDGMASSNTYGTRLYVYGSTNNVPARYDKKLEFAMSAVNATAPSGKKYIHDIARAISPTMFKSGTGVTITHSEDYNAISPLTLTGSYSGQYYYCGKKLTTPTTYPQKFQGVVDVTPQIVIRLGLPTTLTDVDYFEVSVNLTFNDNKISKVFKRNYEGGPILIDYVSDTFVSALETTNNKIGLEMAVYAYYNGKANEFPLVNGVDYTCGFKPVIKRTKVETSMLLSNGTTIPCVINPLFKDLNEEGVGYIEIGSSYYQSGGTFRLPYIDAYSVPTAYFSTISAISLSQSERRLHMDDTTAVGESYKKVGLYIQDKNISDAEVVEETVVFDDIYPKCELEVTEVSSIISETKDEDGYVTEHIYYSVAVRQKNGSPFVFNRDYILDGQEITMKFESGKLNGYTFGAIFYPNGRDGTNDGHQVYELKVETTNDMEIPNTTMCPSVGDDVILFGWDTSKAGFDQLVASAEQKLYERGVTYLNKSKIESTTFTCPMMSDYVYERGLDGDVWKYNLGIFKIGQKVSLYSSLLNGGVRTSRIIGAEIKLDYQYDTPKYTVGEASAYSIFDELGNKESKASLLGNAKSVDVSEALDMTTVKEGLNVISKGSNKLPVYFDTLGKAQEIDSLDVEGDVISHGGDVIAYGGVVAYGIADLSQSGGGGGTDLDVETYDELNSANDEDTQSVATAYSVAQIKDDIGIDKIPLYDSSKAYQRGDVVRFKLNGENEYHAYRFSRSVTPTEGYGTGVFVRVGFNELAQPLAITDIIGVLTSMN